MKFLTRLVRPDEFMLAAAVTMVVLPLIRFVPFWAVLFCCVCSHWRFISQEKNWKAINRLLLTLLGITAVTIVLVKFGTIFGRDAGVTLLVMMIGLKLLEGKTQRDIHIAIFICFFVIVVSFIYERSILLMLYMLVPLTLFIIVQIELNQAKRQFRPAFKKSLLLVVQSFPLVVVLYLLFPRIDGPLWSLPDGPPTGVTGLSDTISFGDIGELVQSDEIAFRVTFEDTPPPEEEMYWRGPVLSATDGKVWRKTNTLSNRPSIQIKGNRSRYEITLEPHYQKWLPALDLPLFVQGYHTRTNSELLIETTNKIDRTLRYQGTSLISGSQNPINRSLPSHVYTVLPKKQNPLTHRLAKQLRSQSVSDRDYVDKVLSLIGGGDYYYSLRPPLVVGSDLIDQFLFNHKIGFCEHYSASFTYLMRAAGIPARIVTGYQGAEYNASGNYWLVRQKFAHAWTEVWIRGEGWTRVDPTAAIPAENIYNDISDRLGEHSNRFGLSIELSATAQWLKSLGQQLDTVKHLWNQVVLSYNAKQQMELLRHFGFDKPKIEKWLLILCCATIIVSIIIAIPILLKGKQRNYNDKVDYYFQKLLKKLHRAGVSCKDNMGPMELLLAVERHPSKSSKHFQVSLQYYIDLRYQANPDLEGLKRFITSVKEIS